MKNKSFKIAAGNGSIILTDKIAAGNGSIILLGEKNRLKIKTGIFYKLK